VIADSVVKKIWVLLIRRSISSFLMLQEVLKDDDFLEDQIGYTDQCV
jgi:hypothetical protein